MGLRVSQEKLLLALRELEDEGDEREREDLVSRMAASTGYTKSTIRTYLSKRLLGRLVMESGDRYRVVGANAISEDDFGRLMSQKLGASGSSAIGGREEWVAELRRVAAVGAARGYRLDDADAELMLGLFAEPENGDDPTS